jgi:hypothetical protein
MTPFGWSKTKTNTTFLSGFIAKEMGNTPSLDGKIRHFSPRLTDDSLAS